MGCFRDHIVTAWIGNSVKVATKHCLPIDDRHFEEECAPGAVRDGTG
jgi:hypothetical protein